MTLKLHNYNVGYSGQKPLIQNINLQMDIGQRLIVFGANGTGKSSFLKSLTQAPVWSLPSENILYISQASHFQNFTPDTVEDYLVKSLLLYSPFKNRKSVIEKVREICDRLHLKNHALQVLSGGQKQKLKMARALLNKSPVLLLDEPFNAVDMPSKMEIISLLNEIKSQTLQILVLHDFFEIEQLSSPILCIQEGQAELRAFNSWFQEMDQIFHKSIHHHKSSREAHPWS